MSRGRADAEATPLWHWGELGCGANDKRAAWDAAAAREREVAVLARRHWNATVRAHYRPPPVAARTIPARRLGVPAAPGASPWSPSKGSKGMPPARAFRGAAGAYPLSHCYLVDPTAGRSGGCGRDAREYGRWRARCCSAPPAETRPGRSAASRAARLSPAPRRATGAAPEAG